MTGLSVMTECVADYPRPKIPPRPVLSCHAFAPGGPALLPESAFKAPGARELTSGRIAIAWALRAMDLAPGDEVLLPAFNCPSVVTPIRWVGAKPVFYRVNKDLSVDLEDIAQKMSTHSRALLVIHYFGFPQNMTEIMRFARARGIAVIEDCAHSVHSSRDGVVVGSSGDFAIASAMKIFPTTDGGYVVARGVPLSEPASGGIRFEIKSILDAIESATRFGRLRIFGLLLRGKRLLRSMLRGGTTLQTTSSSIPGSSEGGSEFEPEWMNVKMSAASRWLSRRVSVARIVARRRANYLALDSALRGIPGATPVFEMLPFGVVPYAYPLVVSEEGSVFPILKRAGVPIFRWELANSTACQTSAWYRRHLLQFPCHQELSDAEVRWMIGEISRALVDNGQPHSVSE